MAALQTAVHHCQQQSEKGEGPYLVSVLCGYEVRNLGREVAEGWQSESIKRRSRVPLSPLGAIQDTSDVSELGFCLCTRKLCPVSFSAWLRRASGRL